MPTRTPLADLIEGRMHELGLDAEALGFRLGCYRNPLKAAGRVHALIDGRALARLPEALGVAPEVVDVAVEDTRDLLAHMEGMPRRTAVASWRKRNVPGKPPSSLMP